MTKKKYNRFLDVITVLIILFPLIMCIVTARSNGTFDIVSINGYVNQFVISEDLALLIQCSTDTFGFGINGSFSYPACVIMSNALLIWCFRVFIAVLTFIPKFSIKLLNLLVGDRD